MISEYMDFAPATTPTQAMPGYGYVPYSGQTMPIQFAPASITEEERQLVAKNSNKNSSFNLNVTQEEYVSAMCNHHDDNGQPCVIQLNDNSGKYYCPRCHTIFRPTQVDSETAAENFRIVYDMIETAKMCSTSGVEFIREYMTWRPLYDRAVDFYNHSMKNFDNIVLRGGYINAHDTSAQNAFNGTFFNGNRYNNYYANQPQYANSVYPNNANVYQQPMMQNGYYQQPMAPVNNQFTNPMQTPMGVNPAAQNMQFVDQANAMVNGGIPVYGQAPTYQQPTMTYTPNVQPAAYANANAYQPNAAAPVFQTPQPVTAQAQPAATPTATVTATAPSGDATVNAEVKVNL